MSNSVIIRRCATLSEAHICAGLLNSHGIWARIDNAEHAAVDWGSIPAFGGVSVRVFASDYDTAKRVIIDAISSAPERLTAAAGKTDPIVRTRRWRALSMLIIWIGVLELATTPLLVWLNKVIPKQWVPDPDPNDFWVSVSEGVSIAPPGPGAEGVLLFMLIALLLLWELLTTQHKPTSKDPQV